MTAENSFFPAGVDAANGGYLYAPPSGAELASLLRGRRKRGPDAAVEVRGTRLGVDPLDLSSAGWGAVFARDADPAIREALAPLLAHRRTVAAARDERFFREMTGEAGYQPGESKIDFLARHRVGPGPANPRRLPYYLLLVGGPEEIPFELQQTLDVQYAVGRLAFDTPEDYHRYALAVVASETAPPPPTRRAALFGVENADDRASHLMATHLVPRLATALAEETGVVQLETVVGPAATKTRLGSLLAGSAVPSLLFAAAHGLGFALGAPLQRSFQGALVCSDWPGPKVWNGPSPREHYFAAEDLAATARCDGLIAFFFACHGAGTPRFDATMTTAEPRPLAPEAFVARLPQRLLAGGALAVVGHVQRAWGYSYIWDGSGVQTAVFEDALRGILSGQPVGCAVEPFNERYAELAAELSEALKPMSRTSEDELLRLATAAEDARNYVILGDPAVRLPTTRSQ